MDDEGEDVAVDFRRGMLRIDQRQVLGRLARRPGLEPTRPLVQFLRRIGGLHRIAAGLQAGVDEVGGQVGDLRIGVVLGVDVGDPVLAQQGRVGRRAEAVVPHLERVAQGPAVQGLGQQAEEALEVVRIELLGVGQLPEQGTEAVA